MVVEHDVATLGIAHTAVHLQILEVGARSSLLQAEYIALADTFQYVGRAFLIRVLIFCIRNGVGQRGVVHALTDDRYVWRIHINGWVGITLTVTASYLAVFVSRNLVVALLDEDAETLAGICALGCCCKCCLEVAVGWDDEVVESLGYSWLGLGSEVQNDCLVCSIVCQIGYRTCSEFEGISRSVVQAFVCEGDGLA